MSQRENKKMQHQEWAVQQPSGIGGSEDKQKELTKSGWGWKCIAHTRCGVNAEVPAWS